MHKNKYALVITSFITHGLFLLLSDHLFHNKKKSHSYPNVFAQLTRVMEQLKMKYS